MFGTKDGLERAREDNEEQRESKVRDGHNRGTITPGHRPSPLHSSAAEQEVGEAALLS